jgi:RNA-binding protein YhbY
MDEIKTLIMGKAGITNPFVSEAKVLLRKHRRLRIRVLKSALGQERTGVLAGEVASRTGAILVGVRGHVITLSLR